jgi:hypothetical protein
VGTPRGHSACYPGCVRGFGWITRWATFAAAFACSIFLLASSGVVAFASAGDGPMRCEKPSEATPFWQPFCRIGELPQRTPEESPEKPERPAFDYGMAVEGLCKEPKGYTSDLFCRIDEDRPAVPQPPGEGGLP